MNASWHDLLRPQARVAAAVLTALLLSSCVVGDSGSRGAPLPPSPPTFPVTMRDFVFEHPPQISAGPGGRIVFRVTNAGTMVHALSLLRLPEDLPPILDQLRGEQRRPVDTLVNLRNRPPGSEDTFAVDLAPGRYALVCFTLDADGVPHALKGMASEFRVIS